ncbi:7768_t:CDS:2, partial [Rhizophagus irregularis]
NHRVCQPHFVQDGPSVLEFKELRHPYITPRNPVKFRFRTPEAEKKAKEEADGKKAEA